MSVRAAAHAKGRPIRPARGFCTARRENKPVGAEILSPSCDLGVFVDQAAEPVPPQNPDLSPGAWYAPRSGGRILMDSPVRPAGVAMAGILAQDQPQVPFAGDQHPVQALAPAAGDPALRDRVRRAPGPES